MGQADDPIGAPLLDLTGPRNPKNSGTFGRGDPRFIVLHYTATTTLEQAVATLENRQLDVSAHFVVGLEGEVRQLGGLEQVLWHAGRSSWRGHDGLNRRSIGIEIVNPGWLTEDGEGVLRTWFGRKLPDAYGAARAIHRNGGPERWWAAFPEAQLAAVRALVLQLRARVPTLIEVVGHDEIAPGRKHDPGPLFPLDVFKALLEAHSGDEIRRVTARHLNVRVGPGRTYDLARRPLPRGARVRILDVDDGWSRVAAAATQAQLGWVASRFLAA